MTQPTKPLCTLRMVPYPDKELRLQSQDESVCISFHLLPNGEYEVASIKVMDYVFRGTEEE